jgi:hypothetical protein
MCQAKEDIINGIRKYFSNFVSRINIVYGQMALNGSPEPTFETDNICPILFRYAEVLLTIAEINVEKNSNLNRMMVITYRKEFKKTVINLHS